MEITLLPMITAFGCKSNTESRQFEEAAKSVTVSPEHEPTNHLGQVLLQYATLFVDVPLSAGRLVYACIISLQVRHLSRIRNAC